MDFCSIPINLFAAESRILNCFLEAVAKRHQVWYYFDCLKSNRAISKTPATKAQRLLVNSVTVPDCGFTVQGKVMN